MNSSGTNLRNPKLTHTIDANTGRFRAGAFTLVELLVVILVLALLTAIVAPYMTVATEQAGQADCRAKLNALHKAAMNYGSANSNRMPIVHEATSTGMTGRILASGGKFAEKYLGQSRNGQGSTNPSKYAKMLKADNAFQCPSALDNVDQFPKKEGTNYSLSGFGLYTGGGSNLYPEGEHPDTMKIGGMVQKLAETGSGARPGTKRHPSGQVAIAVDWIRVRGSSSNQSQYNHYKGANVLYGSGATKWLEYGDMIRVTSMSGMLVPPGTYGFAKSGKNGTHIYSPRGTIIKPGVAVKDRRKPGVGVMW